MNSTRDPGKTTTNSLSPALFWIGCGLVILLGGLYFARAIPFVLYFLRFLRWLVLYFINPASAHGF